MYTLQGERQYIKLLQSYLLETVYEVSATDTSTNNLQTWNELSVCLNIGKLVISVSVIKKLGKLNNSTSFSCSELDWTTLTSKNSSPQEILLNQMVYWHTEVLSGDSTYFGTETLHCSDSKIQTCKVLSYYL